MRQGKQVQSGKTMIITTATTRKGVVSARPIHPAMGVGTGASRGMGVG